MVNLKPKRPKKRKLGAKKPTIWIGKKGLSEEVVAEIEKHLERRKTVKVKILKTALITDNTKSIAKKIAQHTNSMLIEVKGHTFTLAEK